MSDMSFIREVQSFIKINDDECRCCTSGERYKNYRFNGMVLSKE